MIVYSPGLFLHLLDIGPGHEPCCHIILPHSLLGPEQWTVLRNPLNGAEVINLVTLELAHFVIEPKTLIKAYQDLEGGIPNKLSILHYFLVHHQDFEIVSELLLSMAENCLNPEVIKIFHEVLVGGAFSSVLKSLSSDALPLLRFLPFTTVSGAAAIELKINGYMMTITQESLWNPAVMLLSPRQRVCSHRIDLWTKLWDLIAASADVVRFKPSTVVEKLMVSLVCYQPEALSRCSTPLSPGSFSGSTALADMSSIVNGRAKPQLPFYEIEKCTASKQEHIISVNLRELSMHLVKHERESPMQVHAVATRHAAAQLEMSRYLCGIITRSAAVSVHQAKGFQLVNELSSARRLVLFSLFEKFSLAVDALAYPLPQGFSSFFTYLAYCTLPFDTFVQYVQANALQLQIDVMKIIMNDLGNRSDGVKRKLRLLLLLPRSRAKRILNQWPHPASLMIRAREHSANILSGLETRTHLHRTKTHSNAGKL
ncbi:hypothetical protein AAG570_012680 [Ranatra chinensis]|uniref:Gamma-secretase-activating protein C-terminal domain-containing protein n=1 Tax=Ranatra chinensis TaxID=642074 RepID=A0ABD0YEJ4_9HEMI